jgi:hypothetical protein
VRSDATRCGTGRVEVGEFAEPVVSCQVQVFSFQERGAGRGSLASTLTERRYK